MFDPNETENLAAHDASRPTLAAMRARLELWMRQTRDPLLDGPVPAPPGAVVNDPDALSPKDRPRPIGQGRKASAPNGSS